MYQIFAEIHSYLANVNNITITSGKAAREEGVCLTKSNRPIAAQVSSFTSMTRM